MDLFSPCHVRLPPWDRKTIFHPRYAIYYLAILIINEQFQVALTFNIKREHQILQQLCLIVLPISLAHLAHVI